MGLGLEARAHVDQLGPVAHQLSQLPGGRWGDPGLGQRSQAQEVGQQHRVTDVVLHATVGGDALHAQRMGQMQGGATLLEDIGGPIPPVGRFDHDVGGGAGGGDGRGQGYGVVV